VPQAIAHPHHRQRGTIREISDRLLGEFDIPGMPLKFSNYPEYLPLQAPFLGEQNREILTEWLNYSVDRINTLENSGVLVGADR
jgi:crotonobetainyl-CoA:carnitine CoA-transferase CaiB-like acyl-CoA transferase